MKKLYTQLLDKKSGANAGAGHEASRNEPADLSSRKQVKKSAASRPVRVRPVRADTRALFEYMESRQLAGQDAKPVRPAYSRNRIDKNLITVLRRDSFETEMFKVLRGKITHPVDGDAPKSILITSAVSGEGKSFVAANLAVTIAEFINEHVLLMDCDLRDPCIHKRFGFPQVFGLNEYLKDGRPLSSLLLKTMVKKLSILPGGKPPHNPSEILASPKMTDLIGELKSRYADRRLIIDAPPPNVAPETIALSKQVDAILVVVRHQHTPVSLVREAIDSFQKGKILGLVINHFDGGLSRHYGYGRYKQYKKYYRQ